MATQSDFRVKKGLIVGTTDAANPEAGTFTYDSDFNTVDLTLDANVKARLAQDHYFYVKAGATITKGDVVYASGAVGNSGKIEVSPYIANNTIEELLVLGVAAEDISTGNFGYAAQFGSIRGLDASGGLTTGGETWNNGDILYASPTYAGELTKTKPSAPNQDIPIAFVVSDNGSNGTIAVRASRLGYHMDEIHDVEITSIADKDLLVYNTSNSRWENGKTLGDITTGTISASDVTLTGELNGPATFYIDPAPHDPDTDGATNGLVVIRGDLQVDGTTTTVNSTTVEVADKNIVLGANATADAQNDGAGITVTQPDSTDAQIYWDQSNSDWSVTNGLRIYGPHPTNNFNGQLIIKGTETDGLIGSGGGINFYFDNGADGGETRGGSFIYAGKENNTAGDDDSYLSFGTRQEGSDPEVRIHIASDGKVGIGTDSPGSKLEVYNSTTSGNTQLHIHNDKAGDAAVLRLEGKRTSLNDTGQVLFVNSGNVVAKIDARSAADDGALRFFTSATGTGSVISEAMSISTAGVGTFVSDLVVNGKLGINENSLSSNARLHVRYDNAQSYNAYNALTNPSAIVKNLTAGASKFTTLGFYTESNGEGAISLVQGSGNINADMTFSLRSSGSRTEHLRITHDGKVGIGTASPSASYKLDVDGLIAARGGARAIAFDNLESTGRYGIGFGAYDGLAVTQMFANSGYGSSAVGLGFDNNGTITPALLVRNGGNVGIGTTGPSQKLEVNGNVLSQGYYGTGTTTGNIVFSLGTSTQSPSMAVWGQDHSTYPGQVHIVSRSSNASTESGKISFWDFTGSSFQRNVTIDKSGNVGIGTSSPEYKLDVADGYRSHMLSTSGEGGHAVQDGVVETKGHSFALGGGGSVLISDATVSGSNQWTVIFKGHWANNYEGGGLIQSPPITVVSDGYPRVDVGSTDVVVDIDPSTSRLRAVNQNSGYAVHFTGTIEVLISRQGSMSLSAPIKTNGIQLKPNQNMGGSGGGTPLGSYANGLILDTPLYKEYQYYWGGNNRTHTTTLTCGSYFMAEVVYVSNQTNSGGNSEGINRYIRGKWANNYSSHNWVPFEDSGSTDTVSLSISATDNSAADSYGNAGPYSGRLTITETVGSGSYSGTRLMVRVWYSGHNIYHDES